jgi:hypothetical protein
MTQPYVSYNSPFTGDIVQPTDVSLEQITLSVNSSLVWQTSSPGSNPGALYSTTYVAARIIEVTPTAAGFTLSLPPASQSSLGNDILLVNRGAFPFSVTDASGQGLVPVFASTTTGSVVYFYQVTATDGAGSSNPSWHLFNYGAGAAPNLLIGVAGYGLDSTPTAASPSQLNVAIAFSQITSPTYSVQYTDRAQLLLYNGTTSTIFTMPAAAAVGKDWFTYIRNNANNTLTIGTVGTDTIDTPVGAAAVNSITLQAGESLVLTTDGVGAYFSVGRGRSTVFQFTSTLIDIGGQSGNYPLPSNQTGVPILRFVHVNALTPPAQFNVVLPAATAVYYITNDSTTGIPITFQLANAATFAVTMPSGQSNILVSDGSNLFLATPQITGGAVQLTLIPGSQTAPALNWEGDYSVGWFHPASGEMAAVGNGARLQTIIAPCAAAIIPKGVYSGCATVLATPQGVVLGGSNTKFWAGTF